MARNNTETKEAANRDEKSKGQAEAGRWDAPGETQQPAKDRMTGRLGPSSNLVACQRPNTGRLSLFIPTAPNPGLEPHIPPSPSQFPTRIATKRSIFPET